MAPTLSPLRGWMFGNPLNRRGLQPLRRFAEAQRHTGQGDYRTKKREPVAVPSVERGALKRRIRSLQRRALLARGFRHNAPVGVNYGGDPGVGGAQKPAVVFDCAHARHVEMLPRRSGVSEPSVIRDVHKHISPIEGELSNLVGEDGFVTDERPNSDIALFERDALCASRECSDVARESLGKADEPFERYELAERHEMDLVVTRDPRSTRRNQCCRIEDVGRTIGIAGVLDAHRSSYD